MKNFINFILLCIVAVSARPNEILEIDNYIKECMAENGIDPDWPYNIYDLDKQPTQEAEDCYLACMNKKIGLMNDDGSFNVEYLRQHLDNYEEAVKSFKQFESLLKQCARTVGNDVCKMAGCMHRTAVSD